MIIDTILNTLIYLASSFILFVVGKVVYDLINRRFKLNHELLERDNFAIGLAMGGYYIGLILAIGGAIAGPSKGLVDDLIDIFFFGFCSIILLNVSLFINDKLILRECDNVKELIEDQNSGTGAVVGANSIAMGLVIFGAVSGEGGSLITAFIFWLLGQITLIVAGYVYNWITPYNIHELIEKDNVAVGVEFGGALVAIGNVVRLALEGDFLSWSSNLSSFLIFAILGLVLLPVVRFFVDTLLLPGRSLSAEIALQERPNLGAAFIEAGSYLGASSLLGWGL